jgi:hypothetical protein
MLVNTWAERDSQQMLKIARDAQKIYNRRTTPVPLSLLETTAARWKVISKDGCLSQSVVVHGRDLTISDVRIGAATGDHSDPRYPVPENEPAFAAISNSLHLSKRQMNAAAPVLFGVAMTAVAEWYQRAFRTDWDDLMSDMADLARLTPSTIVPGAPIEFTINANGGAWCCLKCKEPATGHEFMEVRQFVSSE